MLRPVMSQLWQCCVLRSLDGGTALCDNILLIGKTRWGSYSMDEDDVVSREPSASESKSASSDSLDEGLDQRMERL